MILAWKQHFSKVKFSLRHPDHCAFVKSQWQINDGPDFLYFVYRWAIATVFLITLILSITKIEYEVPAKWLIYLTDWGLAICTFQSLLGALMVTTWIIQNVRDGKTEREKKYLHSPFYKFYWACYTIATDLAFLISIIYWTFLYDSSEKLSALNFMSHGLNSILMFVDLFIVGHSISLMHFYLPVLFGLTYMIFSVIYWAAGGTDPYGVSYIYNILDWGNPGSTVLNCFAVLIFYLVLHSFSFCMCLLKLSLFKLIVKTNVQNDTDVNEERHGNVLKEITVTQN